MGIPVLIQSLQSFLQILCFLTLTKAVVTQGEWRKNKYASILMLFFRYAAAEYSLLYLLHCTICRHLAVSFKWIGIQ